MGPGLQLSDRQLAFMRVLWTRGEATAADVHEALAEAGHALAPTTVATVLNRLEKRALVAHRTRGRQYVYRALVAEHEARRSMLARLTDFFFGGDTSALVAHLTDESIGEADLEEVRRIITGEDDGGADNRSAESKEETDG